MSSDVLGSELLAPRGHRFMSCSHTQGAEAGVDKSVLKQYSWITVQWLTVCCAWRPHIMIYSGFALLWLSIGAVLVLISIVGVLQCSWSCRAQAGADGNTSRRNLGGSTTFRGLCHIWKEIDWKPAKLPHSVTYILDFIVRFVLVWKLTSYWLLASWFHLIWLCIGELTRRSQAWSLGRQSTDNAWFLQPCPPINMDRSSNWVDRVQLRSRLYKYP